MNHARPRTIIVAVAAAWLATGCSGSQPTKPTPATTLTGVTVTPATVVGGMTVQGTVTLSAAPTSAATIGLSSDNAVATVQATVTVNAGSSTAAFTVSTSTVGSSTPVQISATFCG